MTLESRVSQSFSYARWNLVTIILGLVCTLMPHPSKGEEASYQYPELVVTPSASKRLAMEAKRENHLAWSNLASIQVGSVGSILAGLLALSDPGRTELKEKRTTEDKPIVYYSGIAAIAVGAGWLGTTSWMASSYRPYSNGVKEVVKMVDIKSGKMEKRLILERLAEEQIRSAAALGWKMKWLSTVTNVLATSLVASTAKNDTTIVTAALAGTMAFTPLLFETHWETQGDLHEEYKKKIYGPVARTSIYYNPETGRLGPLATLALSF